MALTIKEGAARQATHLLGSYLFRQCLLGLCKSNASVSIQQSSSVATHSVIVHFHEMDATLSSLVTQVLASLRGMRLIEERDESSPYGNRHVSNIIRERYTRRAVKIPAVSHELQITSQSIVLRGDGSRFSETITSAFRAFRPGSSDSHVAIIRFFLSS